MVACRFGALEATAHRKEVDVTDIAMLPESWRGVLGDELQLPYFKELTEFVEEERAKGPVYPRARRSSPRWTRRRTTR